MPWLNSLDTTTSPSASAICRLNRTTAGKDTTFVIDFVNDPQSILDAFALYDAGAKIEKAQDPNVVYVLQGDLDKANIYTQADIENYTAVRFKSAAAYTAGDDATHKQLYAATSVPTQRFNDALAAARNAIALDPTLVDAYHTGAQALSDLRKHAEAEVTA